MNHFHHPTHSPAVDPAAIAAAAAAEQKLRELDRQDLAEHFKPIVRGSHSELSESAVLTRRNLMDDAVRFTTDDPEDQWEGASSPYDIPFVPPAKKDEGHCSRCFLIKHQSTLDANSICSDCTGDAG